MRPKFSDSDLRDLRTLGVSDAQVRHLAHALVNIQRVISARPKRRETIALLEGIESLTAELSRKLELLVTQPEPEYGYVHCLLEDAYWKDPKRMDDDGPTSSHHLLPRLAALHKCAKAAREALPDKQTRQAVADPRAIRWIEEALLSGWQADQMPSESPLPPYPDQFLASKAEKGQFRAIAGICFRVVGGNPDPLRAIEAYLSIKRARWEELCETFERSFSESPQ